MFTFEEMQKAARLAVVVGAVFSAFVLFVWPHTDLVKEQRAKAREQAVFTVSNWYIVAPYLTESQRYAIMRQYHITDSELAANWTAYNAK